MVVEISVAVIAAVFVVLVVYLISLLKTAKLTLLQANQSISQVQKDLVGISREATSVIHDANLLIKDVQTKMHAFDPLLVSVSQTGEALAQLTGSAKQVSAAVSNVTDEVSSKITSNKGRIATVVEVAKAGIMLWQKIQSVKQSYSKNEEKKKE